ncbi:MAG: 4'-phosphopantetheinyl transferase superfamily protein [Dermatophilaceae bacterium]
MDGPGLRWLACGENVVPSGESWLVPRERERLARMRFTKRRSEYLLRRCAGKRAVAAAYGLEVTEARLADIAMLNAPGGAPYVEIGGVRADFDISLTDRAGQAVALVGPSGSMAAGTLGIDLEIVEPRSEGFVADFLTPPEQAWVRAQRAASGADGWDAAANLVWSAKEAALKVLRVGLRADTRSVVVTILPAARADGWGELVVDGGAGVRFPGWWRRDGAYLLTLATRVPTEPPAILPGSANLGSAIPTHSWMAQPIHH